MAEPDAFTNRTDWFTAIAALTVWFAHFSLVWGASIIWPVGLTGRVVSVVLTLVAFAALAWLWRRVRPVSIRSVAGLGLALAAVATAFDSLPALLS